MQLPLHVSPVSASFIGLQRLGILPVLSLARLPASSAVSTSPLLVLVSSSALGKIDVIIRMRLSMYCFAKCPGIMPYFARLVNSFLEQLQAEHPY
jgi:hypothetical protein